jgi:hypothetical protein
MSVFIDNRQETVRVDEALEALTVQVVDKVLEYEECEDEFEVSISFVDNNEMRDLNLEYRGIDNTTDVLSFPMMEFTDGDTEEDDEDADADDEEDSEEDDDSQDDSEYVSTTDEYFRPSQSNVRSRSPECNNCVFTDRAARSGNTIH